MSLLDLPRSGSKDQCFVDSNVEGRIVEMVQLIDSFRVGVKLVFILMYVVQRASAALSLFLSLSAVGGAVERRVDSADWHGSLSLSLSRMYVLPE